MVVTRRLRPFRPSQFIDLVIFAGYPRVCRSDLAEAFKILKAPGWFGMAHQRLSHECLPAVFVGWMCSLVSWWCNVDRVLEPYKKITTFLCEVIEHQLYFSLHVSSPQGQCVRFWEYSVLSELRRRNDRLTRFYLLPLLVIYLFIHLQVRPGLLHRVISTLGPSQQGISFWLLWYR